MPGAGFTGELSIKDRQERQGLFDFIRRAIIMGCAQDPATTLAAGGGDQPWRAFAKGYRRDGR